MRSNAVGGGTRTLCLAWEVAIMMPLHGLRFLQLLGISLGPWRSMSIFILKVSFAIEKHISFSALSSKMNRRFV